jgi:hypothetical protein
MSSQLAPVDLTSASVGQNFTINFQTYVKVSPMDTTVTATLAMFNESGCGLNLLFAASGNTHYLPAGAWGKFAVAFNDGSATATVTYVLPNPPVNTLNTIYYAPGEPVPDNFTLGNSPIGIGGTITTSSVQTLSNETTATPVLVIDMGTLANPNQINIYNDGHFIWSILIGGVSHTLMTGSTTGNPLQLGEAGDIVEILGQLQVDQTTALGVATIGGGLTFNGGDANMNGHGVLGAGLVSSTEFNSNSYQDSAGNNGMVITPGGTTRIQGATSISLQVPGGSTQTTIDASGCTSTFFNLGGSVGNYGLYTNSLSRLSTGTVNSSGAGQTITHGLGATPTLVLNTCDDSGPSTTTNGAYSYTSTQFTFFGAAAGVTTRWMALRF